MIHSIDYLLFFTGSSVSTGRQISAQNIMLLLAAIFHGYVRMVLHPDRSNNNSGCCARFIANKPKHKRLFCLSLHQFLDPCAFKYFGFFIENIVSLWICGP